MDDPLPKKKSGAASCLIFGCVGLLLLGALMGGGGYFVLKKGMSAAADDIYARVSADTATMDLDPAERKEADELLLRLRDGVKSGEIGIMDAGKLVKALEDSDLLAYGGLLTAKTLIQSNGELSPEEKADGVLQMSRFADGMSRHLFTQADYDDLLGAIGEVGDRGSVKIDDEPTADEIRDMIARAKAKADEADLGQEGLQIDFLGELQRLVDEVLGPR
ncbi:hypothetical protein Poly30_09290 [Planctomycetes bacterium Poly30]|uniref:Uncharacterized protein n=1 Tax=Saltatorellus ferox TaxID=2528018 RepID=A0A518EMW7_9BACT|nr:hypothetical protein Poly30_09290 [Planctomycetes bacterium Poly30]